MRRRPAYFFDKWIMEAHVYAWVPYRDLADFEIGMNYGCALLLGVVASAFLAVFIWGR